MSEHETREVETEFTAKNLMGGVLERIVGAGERINHVFNHASHVIGGFASVAAVVGGGFSLEHAIDTTKEYMRSIGRVSMLTGLSVNHTDALLESMEKVGIESEFAERIMLGISKKTANAEMHMNALGQATGTTGQMLARLGVNMRKDTIDVFEQLAEKVKQNKLGVAELGIAFGVPRGQVLSLYKMLAKGPEYIRANVEEIGKIGVRQQDMVAFARMGEATREMQATWKRINIIIGTQLAPVLADLLKSGEAKLKGWLERAREFGNTMSSFLREHHQLVINIGKAMLANYAIMKLTGTGAVNNLTKYGGKALGWAFKGEAPGVMAGPGRAGFMGIWDALLARMGIIKWIIGGIGRLSVIGVVIAVAVKAFMMIKDNALGLRTYLLDLWEKIVMRFKGIAIALQPLFSIFSSSGVIGKFFGTVVVSVFHALGAVVDGLLKTMHTLIHVFEILWQEGPKALTQPVRLWETAANAARADMAIAARQERDRKARDAAAQAASRETPTQRDRQPVFDFRGSRFDIKQQFADVDPDRIAVAFANDLAGMGERRVQSSFAPLWAV